MSNSKTTKPASSNVEKVGKDLQDLQLSDAEMGSVKSEEEDSPMHSDDSDDDDYESSEQGYSDDEDLAKGDGDETEADNAEAAQIAKVIQDATGDRVKEDILTRASEAGFETSDVELIAEASGLFREILDGLHVLIPNPSADHIVSLLAAYSPNLKDKSRNFAWFGKNALAEDYLTIARKTFGEGNQGLEALLSGDVLGNVWVDGDDGHGVISIVKLARALKARV